MSKVIRLGDTHSHGGKVVSVSATHYEVDGIPVARVGDLCVCPKKGHQVCVVAEGDPDYVIDGVAVAFEGHKTSCGATLISSVPNFSKG